MKVAVVGAGKMGLPLACQFAHQGASVIACDKNPAVVAAINEGRCLIDEPGVPELLAETVKAGRLRATTDTTAATRESDVVVVIVPAVLTPQRHIDVSILESASRQIAEGLRPGMLVSYETTLPVGGTQRYLKPLLEAGGLKAGVDFDLVFSPERVKSQRVLLHLTKTPKVVGGITPSAAQRGEEFYGRYLGALVINVGTLEAAEMVKLAGMVYRDLNIALSNELARYAEAVGVDLAPVIEAANTDGEAFLLHPGIGVGGHCTPVYPYFLIHDAANKGIPATLSERARRINDGQASHVLDRVEREWDKLQSKRILILGLGFRPQVKEHIYSTAFLLRDELRQRGAEVRLHDPLYSAEEITACGFVPGSLEDSPAPEVIVLNTAHADYAALDFPALAKRGVQVIVDGRNAWDPETVRQAGLNYLGVGRPASSGKATGGKRIPVARPVLAGEEAEAAADVIRSGWILQGPQVAAFEREFAAYVGAPFACAVSSGTTALHLALLAVSVRPGDEVITVSHSFIATANSVRYCGATPVFVDIEPDTCNLDPRLIESAITERTRAILCVHQMGMPCDLATILEIGRRHRLAVVEDAACAIGSEILWQGNWERIGKPHANIACFSLHPRKVITTGDGGMITTANAEWDRLWRLWRNHGMSLPAAARQGAKQVVFESYPEFGYNYRMTDIQAAVGREQLKRLPHLIAERRSLAARYQKLLAGCPGLGLPREPAWARSNWQSYCVRLPKHSNQRKVMQALLDAGIDARRGVMCAHREAAYTQAYGQQSLAASEQATDHTVILPLYPQMTGADQDKVVATLKDALSS